MDNEVVEEIVEPQQKRQVFILINPPQMETKVTSDGAERIDGENFLIQEVLFNDVQKGQWFFLVEPKDDINDKQNIMQDDQGNFLFNCETPSSDGESMQVSYLDEFSLEDKIVTMDRIKTLLAAKEIIVK